MTISPRGLTISEWCDYMVDELEGYGQAPFLQDESKWQEWGQHLRNLPGVAGQNPPDPMQFTDFYDWAEMFNLTVTTP